MSFMLVQCGCGSIGTYGCFANPYDSERSMDLHARVCVRQLELSDSRGWRNLPKTILLGKIITVRNFPPT